MSNEIKLEINERPLTSAVDRTNASLKELMQMMELLATRGTSSYAKLEEAAKNAINSELGNTNRYLTSLDVRLKASKEASKTIVGDVTTSAAALREAYISMQGNAEGHSQTMLRLVRNLNAATQQNYETALAERLSSYRGFTAAELRAAKDGGAILSREQNAYLKQAEADQKLSLTRLSNAANAMWADKAADTKAALELNESLLKSYLAEVNLAEKTSYELGEALLKSYLAEVTSAEKAANAAAVARRKAVLADIIEEDKAAYELGEALLKSYIAEVTAAEKAANAAAVARRKAHLADIVAEDKAAYELNEAILKSYLAEVTAAEKAAAKYAKALHDDQLRDEIRYQAERAAAAKAGSAAVVRANNGINGMDFKTANAGLRGLTQGFGMLSIGISSMLPFLASFGAGFAFINTIKVGVAFEKSMFEIQELAGASTAQMNLLRESMSKLADTTQYKPTEMAEGLSVLSLAGLNANEAMAALVPTLNFAAAGGVRLEAAAGTLVAVGTAYGYSSDKFTTVADVIAKTAADTMSSVTNMSEAFKTSSVVAQQYGLALDDTARSLGMLAQIGITGSAAGTSYRNMITEFNKGTGRAAEAIKAMGIQVTDTTGATRPLSLVMRELTAGLVTYTGASQQRILQDMTTERGAKATAAYQAAALIQMNKMLPTLQQEIDYLRKSGKEAEAKAHAVKAVGDAYAELDKKAAASQQSQAGMTFFANLEKQFKPAEQLSGIAASLQESFLKTFKALEAPLFNLGQEIRNLFKSDEFRSGLTAVASLMLSLVETTVDVTKFLIEHSKAVWTVVAAYVALKVAIGTGLLTDLGVSIARYAGVATAASAAAAASTAAAAATTQVSVASSIGTAATVAWGGAMAWAAGAAGTLNVALATAGMTIGVSAGAVLAITAGVIALGVAVVALAGYWLLADTEAEKALNTQRDAANARKDIAKQEVKAIEDQLVIQAEQLDASNKSNAEILSTRRNNAILERAIAKETLAAFVANQEKKYALEKTHTDMVIKLKKMVVSEAEIEEKTRVDAANARIDTWQKEKEQILEAIRLNEIRNLTSLFGGNKSREEAEAIADKNHSNALNRISGETMAMKNGMAARIKLAVELQTKLAEMDKAGAGTSRAVGGDIYSSKSPAEQIKAQREAAALKAKEDALLKVTDAIGKFNKGTFDMEQSLEKVTVAQQFETDTILLLDKAVAMGAITWQNANKVIKEIEAAKAARDDAEEVNGIQKIIDATRLLNAKLSESIGLNTKATEAQALSAKLSITSAGLTEEKAKRLADEARALIAVAKSLEVVRKDQEAYNKAMEENAKTSKEIRILIATINVQSKAEKELEANRAEALRQGPEYLAKLEAEVSVTEKYAGQIAKLTDELNLQEAAYNKIRDASDSWELVDSGKLNKTRTDLNELIALVAKLRGEAGDNALSKALTVERNAFSSSLADAVMTGLEEGTEAGVASMRKVIENEFLRKPIQLFIKATISEILGGKNGDTSLSGVMAGIADGSSLTRLAGLGANLAGVGSINAAAGNFAMSSTGSSLGLSTNSANFLGPTMPGAGNTLTSAGTVASNLPYMAMLTAYQQGGVGGFASGTASIALGGAITGGISALTAGTSVMAGAASGLTAALAAVPVYGWIALGAAALLGSGNKKWETTYGGDFTADASGVRQTRGNGTGGNFTGQVMEQSLVGTIVNINSMLAGLGSKSTVGSLSGGANSNQEKSESYSFAGGTLSNGQTFGTPTRLTDNLGKMAPDAVLTAFGDDLKRATLQALQAAGDLPKTVSNMIAAVDFTAMDGKALGTAYDTVNKLITDTQGLRAVLSTLPFKNLTDLSFDAAAGLTAASGGLENLSNNLTGYYDNFYTEEEKRAQAVKNIGNTVRAAGIDISDATIGSATRESFRALFDSIKDLDDPAMQAAAAAMLSVQGAFADITEPIKGVKKAVETLVPALASVGVEVAKVSTEIDKFAATTQFVGFDAGGLGKMILDAALNPGEAKTSAEAFGEALNDSIKNTLLTLTVNQIAKSLYESIIMPVVLGQTVSKAITDTAISEAKAQLSRLRVLFDSVEFKATITGMTDLVAGLLPSVTTLGGGIATVGAEITTTGVTIGGVLEKFQTGFLTNAERLVIQQKKMDDEFRELGMATPATAADFRRLVTTLQDGGKASEPTLLAVLNLSDGMLTLGNLADAAAADVRNANQVIEDSATAAQTALDNLSASVAKLVGFDGAGLGTMLMNTVFNPVEGKAAAEVFGATLTATVKNTLVSSVVGEISKSIFTGIVVPMVLGQTVSKSIVAETMKTAKIQLTALNNLFKSDEFKGSLNEVVNSLSEIIPIIDGLVVNTGLAAQTAADAAKSAETAAKNAADAAQKSADDFRASQDKLYADIKSLREQARTEEVAAHKRVMDAQTNWTNAVKSSIKTFEDFLGSMKSADKPTVQLAGARENFNELYNRAQGGDAVAVSQMTTAGKTLLDLSYGYSATLQDYKRDQAKVRMVMEQGIAVGKTALVQAEQMAWQRANPGKDLPKVIPATDLSKTIDPLQAARDELAAALLAEAVAVETSAKVKVSELGVEKTLREQYIALVAKLADWNDRFQWTETFNKEVTDLITGTDLTATTLVTLVGTTDTGLTGVKTKFTDLGTEITKLTTANTDLTEDYGELGTSLLNLGGALSKGLSGDQLTPYITAVINTYKNLGESITNVKTSSNDLITAYNSLGTVVTAAVGTPTTGITGLITGATKLGDVYNLAAGATVTINFTGAQPAVKSLIDNFNASAGSVVTLNFTGAQPAVKSLIDNFNASANSVVTLKFEGAQGAVSALVTNFNASAGSVVTLDFKGTQGAVSALVTNFNASANSVVTLSFTGTQDAVGALKDKFNASANSVVPIDFSGAASAVSNLTKAYNDAANVVANRPTAPTPTPDLTPTPTGTTYGDFMFKDGTITNVKTAESWDAAFIADQAQQFGTKYGKPATLARAVELGIGEGVSSDVLTALRGYLPTGVRPSFKVGANIIPHDMTANLHEGEAVIPKAFNPALHGPDYTAMVQELRAMREEVRQLRKDNSAENHAIVMHTQKTAKTLHRTTLGGKAMQVESESTVEVLGL